MKESGPAQNNNLTLEGAKGRHGIYGKDYDDPLCLIQIAVDSICTQFGKEAKWDNVKAQRDLLSFSYKNISGVQAFKVFV
jgi:hypothetical protein